MIIINICYIASVMFEQATYRINENSAIPLRPVLVLSQQFPNPVTVVVTAQNGTAEGKVYACKVC